MRPDIGVVSFMHLAQKHTTVKCTPGCGDENDTAPLLVVPRHRPKAHQALTGIRGEGPCTEHKTRHNRGCLMGRTRGLAQMVLGLTFKSAPGLLCL